MDDRRHAIARSGLALLTLAILIATILSSCGSDDEHLGSIPAAPDTARELTAAEIPFNPDAVARDFRESLGASTVEIRAYSLPASTTFPQIVAHYQGLLPGRWSEQSSEALESARAEGRDGIFWTNDDTREILSLQYVAVPDLDTNILIVIYAQRD
ncbi:MAG TPA: hypothetical protein VLC95_18195 [Anaerolineae bacterium]|nr:hypothetical protein [Anaerolineae bacterium]